MEDKLIVRYKKYGCKINSNLLDTKDAWDNLEGIKDLHKEKFEIYEKIEETDDREELHKLDKDLTSIEFDLQTLWGFSLDIKFHKFWYRPKCSCAKMDNDDAYPTGYYSSNGDCLLHGRG